MAGRTAEKKRRLDSMNSADRDEAVKRLEREREEVVCEIEKILKSYAKESGNRALRRKKSRRDRAKAPDIDI